MRFAILILALFAFGPAWGQGKCSAAFAQARGHIKVFQSAVDLEPGRSVFYRLHKHPKSKKTILFLSGLVYPLENSKAYIEKLAEDYNVVEVALSTQLESLKALNGKEPDFVSNREIKRGTEDFAHEIEAVTQAIALRGKFYLVSLSYSSIAIEYARLFPKRLHFYQAIAPLVSSSSKVGVPGMILENSTKFGKAWAAVIDPLDLWGTRNYVEEQKMKLLRQGAYQLARESMGASAIQEIPFPHFKEAVWKMIEATSNFDFRNYLEHELPTIKLVLADGESTNFLKDQVDLWRRVSDKQDLAQLVVIENSKHDLTGSSPLSAAEVTKRLIEQNLSGRELLFNPEAESFTPIRN